MKCLIQNSRFFSDTRTGYL